MSADELAARDPACATVVFETDRARAERLAETSTTFGEWFDAICDDIPQGAKLTGAELREIAEFCWNAGRRLSRHEVVG
jgi:hypothetical protein